MEDYKTLNENDVKLINYCYHVPRRVNDIARHLKISPKNVSVRIKKLSELGEVDIKTRGYNKTYVRAKKGQKQVKYILDILKKLESKKEMDKKEFLSLVPFDPFEEGSYDKFNSVLKVLHSELINEKIVLSKEGEKFLKEHGKSTNKKKD